MKNKKILVLVLVTLFILLTGFILSNTAATFTIISVEYDTEEGYDNLVEISSRKGSFTYTMKNPEKYNVGDEFYGIAFPGFEPLIFGINGKEVTEY